MDRNVTYINYGTTQSERFPIPLGVTSSLIDQRNLIDLLAFAGKYAHLLNYYNVDASNLLVRDGNWSFFTEHELFLLAEIGTYNMEASQNQLTLIRTTLSNKSSSLANMIYALRLLFENTVSILEKLNAWYNRSKDYNLKLSEDLANIITKNIAPHLPVLKAYSLFYEKQTHTGHYLYFDHGRLENFDNEVWQLPWKHHTIEEKEKKLVLEIEGTEDPKEQISKTYSDVAAIAQIIQYNLSYVINTAREQFDDYLNTHDDIKPDLALLLTFFNLFKRAQDKQNAITKRHLDFYYRDALRFKQLPLVPDTTILTIQLVPEVPDLAIQAGTLFDGGKDQAGGSIEYAAKETTVINQVKVADLRTLFVAGNAYVKPYFQLENPEQLITGIYSNVQDLSKLGGSGGFAVIGEDQLEKAPDQRTMQDVQLGFAVSSPVLFLSGGERQLNVTIYFTESSFNDHFYEPLENLTRPVSSLTNEVSLTVDELFAKVFDKAFSIRLTGEKEWVPVSDFQVTYSRENCSLQFSFSLDTADPSIVAYDAAVHGGQFTTSYPLLAFYILNTFPYPVYNFLNNLEVKCIGIEAEVTNLKNVSLYNQYGKIDTSKPFQPLGVQPEKGAYMVIGSPELFSKQLSALTVTLNWQSLPVTIEGQHQYTDFYHYYKAYGLTPPVTNLSFQLTSTYLQNGRWVSFGNNQGLLLYNEQGMVEVPEIISNDAVLPVTIEATTNGGTIKYADGREVQTDGRQQLMEITHLTLQPSQNTITPDDMLVPQMAKPLEYTPETTYGFMKFELSEPLSGFGASLYANTLSAALLKNARVQLEEVLKRKDKTDGATTENLPKTPFTPVASSLSVRYSARDTINLLPEGLQRNGNSSFFHIDAFASYQVGLKSAHQHTREGRESVSEGGAKTGVSLKEKINSDIGSYRLLFPSYYIQGNLYIGLSGVNAPCTLSMYLLLTEKLVQADLNDIPVVKWSFLTGADTWVDFTPGKSITDETFNLTRSGLVRMDLTQEMSNSAIILPGGLFWLRAQVTENLNIFSRLLYVYTQVIEVTYSNPETSQRSDLVLPAGTISKSLQLIQGVKSIQQPLPSYNGVFPEEEQSFYTRVSETLRHKNRAIQVWDYERLILQKFPQVYKAKCISASSLDSSGYAANHFDIVVIPEVKGEGVITDDRFGPVLALSVLEEIENYIKPMASPHVWFNVRNPVYEKLIVRCKVRFKTNDSFYIRQLNNDIKTLLSPWLGNTNKQYRIGEGVQKSTILGFIQQLDYVDFVTAFSVIKIARIKNKFHLYDSARYEKEHPELKDNDILYALTPWSVFVSAANHFIDPISEVVYTEPVMVGIGDLAIEYDFITAKDSGRILPRMESVLYGKTLTKGNDTNQTSEYYLI